jgi:hypothetical protein
MPYAYTWDYCILLQKLCLNLVMSFSDFAVYLFFLCVCKISLLCYADAHRHDTFGNAVRHNQLKTEYF